MCIDNALTCLCRAPTVTKCCQGRRKTWWEQKNRQPKKANSKVTLHQQPCPFSASLGCTKIWEQQICAWLNGRVQVCCRNENLKISRLRICIVICGPLRRRFCHIWDKWWKWPGSWPPASVIEQCSCILRVFLHTNNCCDAWNKAWGLLIVDSCKKNELEGSFLALEKLHQMLVRTKPRRISSHSLPIRKNRVATWAAVGGGDHLVIHIHTRACIC